MMSRVISHNGGDVRVSRSQLAYYPTPESTATWFPVPHATVAETVVSVLDERGYQIKSEKWVLSKKEQRIFGTIDLSIPLTRWDAPGQGASISLGIRSSFDKRLPLGIVAGSRVLVCSNLAFAGEISFKRKHTRNGLDDFRGQVEAAIERLPQYQAMESARFQTWMEYELMAEQADALVLALFEGNYIGLRQFKPVMEELRRPTFDDFGGKMTVWSLFNRITTALRARAEQRAIEHASETSQIIRVLNSAIGSSSRVAAESVVTPLALEYSGN
jgi:hypothetical protein